MKTIYIDSAFKCHVTNDGTMTAVETNYFDGRCDAYIEGYIFVPAGESWTREDGVVFKGEMVFPWKNFEEIDAAQRIYERQLLVEYEANLAELDALILDYQYNNLVEGL